MDRAELSKYLESLFWQTDCNRRGYVSLRQLYNVLTANGLQVTFELFKKRFSNLSIGGDIQVTLDEYLRAMGCPAKHWQRYALYKMMFLKYDKTDSGSITRQQLASTLKEMKVKVTERELDVLFKIIDVNQSGRIEFDEFINFFFNVDIPTKVQ